VNFDFTPGGLFAALLLSAIGLGFFTYGKRQRRAPPAVAGIGIMVLPYFIPGLLWSLVTTGLVLGGLWIACRAGL